MSIDTNRASVIEPILSESRNNRIEQQLFHTDTCPIDRSVISKPLAPWRREPELSLAAPTCRAIVSSFIFTAVTNAHYKYARPDALKRDAS